MKSDFLRGVGLLGVVIWEEGRGGIIVRAGGCSSLLVRLWDGPGGREKMADAAIS
jgi:hypothetical protein